jgi:hypothetical protein
MMLVHSLPSFNRRARHAVILVEHAELLEVFDSVRARDALEVRMGARLYGACAPFRRQSLAADDALDREVYDDGHLLWEG